MKNIEKYPSTKDALDAYNALDSKTVSFDAWLVCEYKEPHAPTLLGAANAVTKAWALHSHGDTLALAAEAIRDLYSTIEREKHKPVRNFSKYETAEEAARAFAKMCRNRSCLTCKFNSSRNVCGCRLKWIYDEAEKEVRQSDAEKQL